MLNMQATLPALLLGPAAVAASQHSGNSWTHSPRYDYIIVGGGTSGLVVANRLSEDYNVSVAIIEAGGVELYDKNITDTAKYMASFGTAVDWQYKSVPQTYAGNATQVLRAGKAIGGTSDINGTWAGLLQPISVLTSCFVRYDISACRNCADQCLGADRKLGLELG
jgi:choline dehydrogenase-like flavoprotein